MKSGKFLAFRTTVAAGLFAACTLVTTLSAGVAHAQAYPTRIVTIVVGFPPAGPLDWMARVLAPKLQERWGQTVIVNNHPGAGGLLAIQAVQKAPPDGHILTPHTQQAALIPLFAKQADIDPGRNLQPLGSVFYTPYLIVANAQAPAKNLREFIAYVKANPGKFNAALATNTGHYLDSIAFTKAAGMDMAYIPYGGGAGVTQSVAANETQLALTTGGMSGFIQAGKVTPLAVTGSSRVSAFPDVPTVKEAAGFDFIGTVDFGYWTTQGTPRPIVDKMTRDIAEIMSTAEIKDAIRKQGFEPAIQSPDVWLAKTVAEVRRAKEIAAAAGITPQ